MKVLVAGDFCPQDRVLKYIDEGHYKKVFCPVMSVIQSADYSVVNFETCIISNNDIPIDKCGPNLGCGEINIDVIKEVGFDCVTLANNHFRDYGNKSVERTIKALDAHGVDHVGGGINIEEASKILYKKIEDKTLAIINACENEFSIATGEIGGSNPLNSINQYYAIREAKETADYILVIIHGGHEGYSLPSPRMVETYRFFVEVGADAVVNHHQHCYSGYEIYKGKPIFYGLGNFCFDNSYYRNDKWNKGYMVQLFFGVDITFELYPYSQCDDDGIVEFINDEQEALFNANIIELNKIIKDPTKLIQEHKKWMDTNEIPIKILFSPWIHGKLKSACARGLLPLLLPKAKVLQLINYINCEAHRDRTLNMLNRLMIHK